MALVRIFFVLLLGVPIGKYGVVDNARVGELNTVVTSYALPASLFAATAASPRHAMLTQWPVLIIVGSTMTLVYPLWYLLQRRLLHRSSGEAALQALTVSLPNVAAVGLPVASALLGPDRSPYQDQRTYGRAPIRLLRHLARIELWLVSEETGSLMISSTVGSTLTLHCRCGIYPRVMRAFRALVSR